VEPHRDVHRVGFDNFGRHRRLPHAKEAAAKFPNPAAPVGAVTIANMSRHNESNAELLLKLPWWVSAMLGILAFAALRWGVPIWAGTDNSRLMFSKGIVPLAPLPLLFFGIFAAGSFWFSRHRRRLVDGQTSIESIRALPWKQFEFLVAEAYRRQGYQIEFSLGRGADGGVDLTLRRDGRTSLVQCKQWKVFSVGAPVIREMFGLMTAEKANEAIIVTSGKFTRDAQDFAADKPIRLIDGPQLLALVQSVQGSNGGTLASGVATDAAPSGAAGAGTACCPSCGQPMVLRTSKRGANAGSQFWGCSTYPACKGTRKFISPIDGSPPKW
jgi:restriction system protein